jgi:hypothetical protein
MGQSRHFGRRPTTSGPPLETDIVRAGRHVSKVPKSDLCVDGDLGLTTRRGGFWSRLVSRMHSQAYISPSSSFVMVPGLHPEGVARLVVTPPAVAVPGAARVVGPHCVVRGATSWTTRPNAIAS